jgi:PAS domain S-box-containing protein
LKPIKIIIVEDFHAETEGVMRELEDADFSYEIEVVRNEIDFKTQLENFQPDVILSTYSLAGTNAVKLLSTTRDLDISVPFILLAFDLSEDIAIDLLSAGIEDYVLRSTLKRLPVAIRKALQRYKIQLELLLSEAKLRGSEASLQEAQKIAHVGSWEWEIDKHEVKCSDEMFRIYCTERKNFTLADMLHFIHPKDKDRVGRLMAKGREDGLLPIQEYTIIAADGTVKDVRSHAEPVINNQGDITKIIGTLQDVTERKKIERELLRSESLLSLGEEISNSGSFELDFNSKRTIWSSNFYRIVGITPGTVITKELFNSCIHPEDRERYKEALAINLKSGVGTPFVYRIIRPDTGQIIHLHANGRRVEGSDGEIRWIGSVLDISERITKQLELELSESSLNEAQKLAQLGSWEMDMETGDLNWSAEMCAIHGVQKQKVTRELFMGLLHPDDKEAVLAADLEAMTGVSDGMIYRIIRADNGEHRTMAGSRATLIGKKLIGTVQDVTDRMRTQLELEAKTVHRDLLLSTSKIGIWHWNVGSNKLICDNQCAKLFEDFTPELEAEQFYHLIHPDDREYVRKRLVDGLKTGDYSAEYRLTKNGTTTYVLSRGRTLCGSDSRATRMDGIIMDMTEQHLLESSKKEREQLFRDMAENISEVFWLTDWELNKVLYISPRYESLYGSSVQELYHDSRSWVKNIHPEDLEFATTQFRLFGSTGEYDIEYRLVMKDGSIKWVRDRSYPVLDANGKIVRVAGITEEITDRKLTQEKIETLSLVASETSNGVLIHNSEGLITWANRGFTEITGYSEEEVVGKEPWSILSGTQTNQSLISEAYQKMVNGETFTSDNILLKKSGEAVWVSTTFNPIMDQTGKLKQIVSIGVDITRQKETEALQKTKLDNLEKANQELRKRGL